MPQGKALNYDEVFRQSSPTNTTVYIGGTSTSDETVIRDVLATIFIFGYKTLCLQTWCGEFVYYFSKVVLNEVIPLRNGIRSVS